MLFPDYVTANLHLSDVIGTPVSYRDTNTQDHVEFLAEIIFPAY